MRIATPLAVAALLAALVGCGEDGAPQQPPAAEQRAEERPATTPRPGSTPAPEATPRPGDKLPTSPPKPRRAKRFKGPTVRYDGARCTPETVRAGEGGTLRVRNQARTSMRFQIPSVGLDIPVRRGGSMNLLVPAGRREYVCRSGDRSAEGVLDVAGGG